MPKYKIKKDAPTLIYGYEGVRKIYEPGDVIELSGEEAMKIGQNLEIIEGKAVKEDAPLRRPQNETPDFVEKGEKRGKKKGK